MVTLITPGNTLISKIPPYTKFNELMALSTISSSASSIAFRSCKNIELPNVKLCSLSNQSPIVFASIASATLAINNSSSAPGSSPVSNNVLPSGMVSSCVAGLPKLFVTVSFFETLFTIEARYLFAYAVIPV